MDTGEHHRKREREKTGSHKPRNARGNQEPGEICKRSFPSTLKGRIALLKLDFRLSASKTMRQYISIAVNHPVCGCYYSPNKLTQWASCCSVNRGKVIQKNSSKEINQQKFWIECLCVLLNCVRHVQLHATPQTPACQGSLPWDSPGKNTGVGGCVLLQGIFPTQGSNSHKPT